MNTSIIKAMAALNKNGHKDLIDFKNYAVFPTRFFLPVAGLTEILTKMPANKLEFSDPERPRIEVGFKDEGEVLTEWVATLVEGSRAYHAAHKTGRENLGFEILSGEDKEKGEVVCLVVFTGRPLTQDEVFRTEQLNKLAAEDTIDFDTMLQKLKAIVEPKVFDAFRAVLSKAGINRQMWNAQRKKDPNAPEHEKYTGHGGAGSGIIWNIPPEKMKNFGKGGKS